MFVWEFDKDKKFRNTVSGWYKTLRDLRWMWPKVAEQIQAHHIKVFDSEGQIAESGGWTPLSPETAKFRFFGYSVPGSYTHAYSSPSREGADSRILHWTGTLRDSMTKDKADGTVRKFHKDHMEFGTSLPYGEAHQEGLEQPIGPNGKMMELPTRKFLDPTGSIPGIAKAINKAITKKFQGD
jgi:hypothetical protein